MKCTLRRRKAEQSGGGEGRGLDGAGGIGWGGLDGGDWMDGVGGVCVEELKCRRTRVDLVFFLGGGGLEWARVDDWSRVEEGTKQNCSQDEKPGITCINGSGVRSKR